MNFNHSNARLRIGLTFVALVATLGLASCRMVENSVTGIDPSSGEYSSQSSECNKRCQKAYKACKEKEEARHRAEKRACDNIADYDKKKECREAEYRRHKAENKQCVTQKQLCKKNCRYREGSGTAGR